MAVLCTRQRAWTGASALALALAAATGRGPALVGVCGVARATDIGTDVRLAPASAGGTPAARRAAGRLRARGVPAAAAGRLVRVLDAPFGQPRDGERDDAGLAAATAARLGRAVTAAAVPGVLALPLARTAALDRVIAWHDGIVVVREPDAPDGMFERVLASVGALGLPVATTVPPSRVHAALAGAGLRPPAEAVQAVAQLGLAARDAGARRDA